MREELKQNEETWNTVADRFTEASALPEWGPFGVGADLNLLSHVTGKTFLEVGCGSGRSIKYLTSQGAKKVYGLDISKVQLKEAARFNQDAITAGTVRLIHGPMEERLTINPVDTVVSIYALGWTQDPQMTLANIYSYLKTGGLFIWSWDHTFFTNVKYFEGNHVVEHSYHKEKSITLNDWSKPGTIAHLTYRKTSTWFQLLIDASFEIIGHYEPEPKNLNRGFKEPEKYYSIDKAKKVPCTMIFVCRKK